MAIGRLIKRFVEANRRASHGLRDRNPSFFGNPSYRLELLRRVREDIERTGLPVLEAGGIDRPMLPRSPDYTYHGLDIEEQERCHEVYDAFVVQSIEEPLPRTYGTIFSMTLLEHVPDNDRSAASMFAALEPGGGTFHYVPGKGHPYALILRLVGPTWQRRLLGALRTEDEARVSGYPTFFHRCTARQMQRLFERSGFEQVEVVPYYRANDYFAFLTPLYVAVTAFENLCRGAGLSYFASGFVLSARRPAPAESGTDR
ncbi:MAG: methyltransferase domain-containing protein [Myxococcota bacterium]